MFYGFHGEAALQFCIQKPLNAVPRNEPEWYLAKARKNVTIQCVRVVLFSRKLQCGKDIRLSGVLDKLPKRSRRLHAYFTGVQSSESVLQQAFSISLCRHFRQRSQDLGTAEPSQLAILSDDLFAPTSDPHFFLSPLE